MLNYIITDSTITVLINGIPQIVDNTHPKFEAISHGIKNDIGEKALLRLIDTATVLREESQGKVTVKDGEVYYGDKVIKNALTKRILSMLEEGYNVDSMCKFMDNLHNNPSSTAIKELYLFLEACNLPITEDGHFLAYKKISHDYKDLYTGTFDNSIGAICEMERNEVDDKRDNTCSHGLHFASYSYMAHYGGTGNGDRIVIVKIDPADVVSIPSDYGNAKGRCYRYEVVNEVNNDGRSEIKSDCIKDEDTYSKEYHENKEAKETVVEETTPVEEVADTVVSMETVIVPASSEDLKKLKDLVVTNLYSNKLTIEEVIDCLDKCSYASADFFKETLEEEQLNFNQAGNLIRDVVMLHELSVGELHDYIEDVVDSYVDDCEDEDYANDYDGDVESDHVPYGATQASTDEGIPYGAGPETIKLYRIKQYEDMFGTNHGLMLKRYANSELRNAIESRTPLHNPRTSYDFNAAIVNIVENVKNEKLSWTAVTSHLPGLPSNIARYNDYHGLRKYLEKATKTGEVSELIVRGILA